MDLRAIAESISNKKGSQKSIVVTFSAPDLYACSQKVKISAKTLVSIRDKYTPEKCRFEFVLSDQAGKHLTAKLIKEVFSDKIGKKIPMPVTRTAVSINSRYQGEKMLAKHTDLKGEVQLDLTKLAETIVYDSKKPAYLQIQFKGASKNSCGDIVKISREKLVAIYEKWSADTFSFKITPPSDGSPKVTALLVREVRQAAGEDKKILPVSNIPITIKYVDVGEEKEAQKETNAKGEIAIDLCDIGRSFLYNVKAPEYVEYRISSPRPFFCKQSIRIIRDDLLNFYKKWDADGNMCLVEEASRFLKWM